jgi:signal transduction histidine kinase
VSHGPLDRLYARLGDRYVPAYFKALYLSSIAMVASATFTLSVVYDEAAWRYLVVFAVGCLCVVASLWLCARRSRRHLEPALRWQRGERGTDSAERAWQSATTAVTSQVLPAFIVCLFGAGLPFAAVIAVMFGLDASAIALLVTSILIFSLHPIVLHSLGFELYLGPLKRDIARDLPVDVERRPGNATLQRWLLITLPCITAVNGLFVAIYTQDDPNRLPLSIALSVVVNLVWTLMLLVLAVRFVLRPVEELTRAARQIRAGDLTARAAPEREDELGLLVMEFNRMTGDLQGARERLVSAREEERRRLRRDLHDGLGSVLAGVRVQLEAAGRALDRDPSRVEALLRDASQATAEALADLRRLVYALRPPALDALGLVGAVREHAQSLSGPDSPVFEVDAPDELPALPAAVEVAALRIAQEAMTNVARHAGATRCEVALALGDGLRIEVRDDGAGVNGAKPGVGTVSMQERAGELGGTLAIEPADGGGTVVRAVLPLAT